MAAYAAHTTTKNTHLLTAQNKTKKIRATQKSLPSGKWRFREKEVRRMGRKQKRIRQNQQQEQAEEQEEI